jgi:hypothetical protein
MENGYAVLTQLWKKGDKIELSIDMQVQMIKARMEIAQDKDRIALQRGPLVYCIEGADNDGRAWNFVLPSNTQFKTVEMNVLDEPVTALEAALPVAQVSGDGLSIKTNFKKVRAIPYYTWANRGKNEMQIWFPEKIQDIKINYLP